MVVSSYRANPGLVADEYLGWKRVLRGSLDVCEIPGRQQNLLLEPNVLHLARELSSRLNAAQVAVSADALGVTPVR